MKLPRRLLMRTLGLGLTTTVRNWMSTLDFQSACYDDACDTVHPDFRGPVIFVLWHEYLLVPFYLRPRTRIAILASRHADAEWLVQAAGFLGFETVRGSSFRGGASALRTLFTTGRRCNLAMTPDGPRGPRRTMAQGPIYLSSKLGAPLVLSGFGFDRPWRLSSWDRFAIPRPYSRCRSILSPAIQIPPDLDRDGIEHYRQEMERLLNRLSDEAEQWAETGCRFHGQQTNVMQSAAHCKLDRQLSTAPNDVAPDDAGPPSHELKLIA